ncbi:MAG: MBL fold metallo-hydrolase [Bacteroidales bacterium]|jgi:competence protein ComEC|nr:MBL fold metallo-hydrolase [Bacteroidales bacterium]
MAETKINFYDVGHGSCTHIITPNNTHILLDIGGGDDMSPAEHLKYFHGVKALNALVLTHPHEDHYHDIKNLEKYGLKPKVLSRNNAGFPIQKTDSNKKDHDKIDCVNDMHKTYIYPVSPENDPFSPTVNGGVSWKSFRPDSADTTNDDPNTYSGLYILEFGGIKVVLTGDNNKEIIVRMIERSDVRTAVKDADFLLAPHHGRTTDFCPEFFNLVNPRATVISDKCCEHDSQECSASCYNNGRGVPFNGDTRHVLTTRSDGNIVLRITDYGGYSFSNWFNRG